MPWWFIPSLIGVVVVSAAAGLLIGYVVLRIQNKPWPFFLRAPVSVVNKQMASISASEPVTINVNPVILELERNLEIATGPMTKDLAGFQVDIWNNRQSEFEIFNSAMLGELTQAYVDMILANNIVWMSNEFGSANQNSVDVYTELRAKVAERLQRIMPDVKDKLGVIN